MTAIAAKLNATGTRRWTVIGVFSLIVGLALYHLMLLVGEAPATRGSYAYYLLISKTVRDLPVLDPQDEPEYVQAMGDVSPAHEAVYFCSRASAERILDFYSAQFTKLGFTLSSRTDTGVRFANTNSNQTIGVGLMPDAGCLRVNLWFVDS